MAAKKVNSALAKPLKVSAELEAVIGKGPMPRTEVVKKLWVYIKKNNLQNPKNMRNILADEKLKTVFGGKKEVICHNFTKKQPNTTRLFFNCLPFKNPYPTSPNFQKFNFINTLTKSNAKE